MHFYYDKMEYRDVVMANYVVNIAEVEQIKSAQDDFLRTVKERGFNYRGPFSYYLEQVNENLVRIHYILPVDNLRILDGKKMFSQSYYGFDNMICIRSTVEELNNLEQILPKMTEQAKADGYEVYGPLYYVFSKIPDDNIVYLKIPIQKS